MSIAACPTRSSGLVASLLDTVDCNIRSLVHDSYLNLVGPGTTFAAVFTGLLTIYVALVGYQLLLGRGGLRVLDLPVAALKIGLILAFITSWAAYQQVVFELLFDGPREIAHALISPMLNATGAGDGDLYHGLERAYAGLTAAAGAYGAQASPAANILQGGPMLGSGLLWLSALLMLLSTIGVILASKIVLAFLLAIGPIFIGLCLFDRTRGFFDGWLRTTVAFALAPLAANVFGAAMLLMLSPFLTSLARSAELNVFDMAPIVAIGLIVSVFALVMTLSFRICAGLAGAFTTASTRPSRARSEQAALLDPALQRANENSEAARPWMSTTADAHASWMDASAMRRTGAIADAVSVDVVATVERLGQSERRPVEPARRRGEDA